MTKEHAFKTLIAFACCNADSDLDCKECPYGEGKDMTYGYCDSRNDAEVAEAVRTLIKGEGDA